MYDIQSQVCNIWRLETFSLSEVIVLEDILAPITYLMPDVIT